jgi:hypothetical protein
MPPPRSLPDSAKEEWKSKPAGIWRPIKVSDNLLLPVRIFVGRGLAVTKSLTIHAGTSR